MTPNPLIISYYQQINQNEREQLQLGLKDLDSIRLTWNRLRQPHQNIADIHVPNAFIQTEYKPDLSIYDALLNGSVES